MRLKDAWDHLAERYACPLDEDDIIDLREVKIFKDRGVVRGFHGQINFGDISVPDEPGIDASSDVGGVHSENEEDDSDEIDTLSHGARAQNGLEAQLRRVKPLRELDSEDEDDLLDFLEAERRVREEFGPVDDEDLGEDPVSRQDEVEDGSGDLADEDVIEILESSDEECEEQDTSRTFSTKADFEDEDEDEDELGGWVHDESTAIYEVVRNPAPPDDEVIEIFDTPPSSPPPSSPSPMSDPPFGRTSTLDSSP
jgi:hypothetical protein